MIGDGAAQPAACVRRAWGTTSVIASSGGRDEVGRPMSSERRVANARVKQVEREMGAVRQGHARRTLPVAGLLGSSFTRLIARCS